MQKNTWIAQLFNISFYLLSRRGMRWDGWYFSLFKTTLMSCIILHYCDYYLYRSLRYSKQRLSPKRRPEYGDMTWPSPELLDHHNKIFLIPRVIPITLVVMAWPQVTDTDTASSRGPIPDNTIRHLHPPSTNLSNECCHSIPTTIRHAVQEKLNKIVTVARNEPNNWPLTFVHSNM